MKLNLLISLAAGFLFIGCTTQQPLTPAVPAQTNAVTGIVTPAIPATFTNVPNTTVMKIVAEGDAIAPVVPAPYNGILTSVLALLAFGATTVATIKNKQLNTASAVATTMTQGIETLGTAAAAVKQSIAKTAVANGNADAVESKVNAVTGSA